MTIRQVNAACGYPLFAVVIFLLAATQAVWGQDHRPAGAIYLVGMGPGDPELLTFKAARILKEADHVFCFGYLKEEVARFVPAEKLTVASPLLRGRYRGQNIEDLPPPLREQARHSVEETARFLPRIRELVASGKKVVFADAGDPTMYCPWTWIVQEFADLKPTIVPGLSSFNAANAALGRSVTHGNGSVLISAGQNLGTPDEHGRLSETLVLFTHRAKFNNLLPRLQSRYPSDTPIAIVTEASYERQQVMFATLETIRARLGDKELPQLYVIYVGDGFLASKSDAETQQSGRAAEVQGDQGR